MADWNSIQYRKFENERTQPSVDLIRRIPIRPRSILDIGCGPGNSTHQLSVCFPDAEILGIDSSDAMLYTAAQTYPGLAFRKCRIPDELDSLPTYDILSAVSREITLWETTYYHIVPSHRSVLEWYKGSGLRPYLEALTPEDAQDFTDDLLREIRSGYPVQADSRVLLKMPRLFFIAARSSEPAPETGKGR